MLPLMLGFKESIMAWLFSGVGTLVLGLFGLVVIKLFFDTWRKKKKPPDRYRLKFETRMKKHIEFLKMLSRMRYKGPRQYGLRMKISRRGDRRNTLSRHVKRNRLRKKARLEEKEARA